MLRRLSECMGVSGLDLGLEVPLSRLSSNSLTTQRLFTVQSLTPKVTQYQPLNLPTGFTAP